MGRSERIRFSELDQLIVAALQINPRAHWRRIAAALDTSETTVARRAKAMIESKLLRFLIAPVIAEELPPTSVFVSIQCTPGQATTVARSLSLVESVRFAVLVSGSTDVLIKCDLPSVLERDRFLLEHLPTVEGVRSYATHFTSRVIKTAEVWARQIVGEGAAQLEPERSVPGPLDAVDLEILDLIRADPRRTVKSIATATGRTETTISKRVDALLTHDAVTFNTYLDPRLTDFNVKAFLWVKADPALLDDVAGALNNLTQVRYMHAVLGEFDLVCDLILASDDLYTFQTDVLGAIPGITQVNFSLELRIVKRSFVIVD